MLYHETKLGKLFKGDCLEVMDELIRDKVKVDAIICDLPYQITKCAWDILIPFNKHILTTKGRSKKLIPMYEDEWIIRECETTNKTIHQCRDEFQEKCIEGMWDKLNKLIKNDGTIALFGSEPFSSALRMSNIKNYKYDWIWEKSKPVGFANAKKMPLKNLETISVFYSSLPTYNPQGLKKCDRTINNSTKVKKQNNITAINGGAFKTNTYKQEFTNYPRQILKYSIEQGLHKTQKPVELMKYIIKTYTNEGELVLDFTSGSGTTAVASEELNRRWICIEKDEDSEGSSLGYLDITVERLNEL